MRAVHWGRPIGAPLFALGTFALAALMPWTAARAQTDSTASIRGSVRVASGEGVADALVLLEQDRLTIARARTLASGTFALPRLLPGTYDISVRRIGYTTERQSITIEAGASTWNPVLSPLPTLLDTVAVGDAWTGIIGIVGDQARMEPLDGVRITHMGGDDSITVDANGRFLLPIDRAGTGAIRVERDGFLPRLVSYTVREGERPLLTILLDSGRVSANTEYVWRDLNQRTRWSTPRTVRVSRGELAATGAHNLLVALERTPSVQASGVIITRSACIFVNGLPRPGFPVDAILTDRVEYVEAYPARTDLSRTLPQRWPAGGRCGAPGGDIANRRAIESGQGAQYVAIWLR